MLIDHIASKDMKAKQILQSSFDLLGEVMKFNIYAFQRFDSYISEQQVSLGLIYLLDYSVVSILKGRETNGSCLTMCLFLTVWEVHAGHDLKCCGLQYVHTLYDPVFGALQIIVKTSTRYDYLFSPSMNLHYLSPINNILMLNCSGVEQ